ncbi:hypothetical protein J4Q44_G00002050 [Coregonus suidteri]|uniref:SWIM-type domain-containing protein n=1 Tax=Coregonus suidteri TaxID=861788 RepID=A0AAN8MIZ1_9TELE
MTLRDSQPVVFVKSYCSCVAGCGICNHFVALLYQTAHYSECGMSVVPPVLSCTETEQKWHKPRTMVCIISIPDSCVTCILASLLIPSHK